MFSFLSTYGPLCSPFICFVRLLIEMTQHMGGGVRRTSQTYLLSNDYTFYHISDDFTLLDIFQVFPCYDYELLRAPIDERRNEDRRHYQKCKESLRVAEQMNMKSGE